MITFAAALAALSTSLITAAVRGVFDPAVGRHRTRAPRSGSLKSTAPRPTGGVRPSAPPLPQEAV